MAFCPFCAAANAENAVVCASCNAALNPSVTPGMPPPPSAPNPYAPPSQQGYQPTYDVQPSFNGMAIAGFVCSFLCSILGIIFSAIALSQIKNSNGTQRGGGLATAGLIISIVSIFLGIMLQLAKH